MKTAHDRGGADADGEDDEAEGDGGLRKGRSMPRKNASPAAAFFATVPETRRADLARVLDALARHMPAGYELALVGKYLVYQVPLARYPDTYNKRPLWYAAVGSGASYMTLYLMPVYGDRTLSARLASGFRNAGKKLDMGKACIRFRKADHLDLETIGEIVASVPMNRWIAIAEAARRR